MSVAGIHRWFLRLEQAESSRLAWAFAISLACHLVVFGGYAAGKKYHLWDNVHWPAWLRPLQMLTEVFKKKETLQAQLPPLPQEAPLMFVDVSPAQATAEPPKNAKFYSDKNSIAANPASKLDSDIPQITGTQKEVPKTEDIPRKEFVPLQPAPAPKPLPPDKVAQEELKPKPAPPPGDLALAKPEPNPPKDPGETPRKRRPTVDEALAKLQNNRLPGEKMKQEGGVKRRLEISSLDAKATPFGEYDRLLVNAISARWFSLLDQQEYASQGRGKVVLHFSLHYDGRVTDMTVAESTVSGMLGIYCQKAVLDPAPFTPWPMEMRRIMGDTRHIQFTFYYN